MQKSVGNKRSETFPYKQKKEEIERCYRGEGERERDYSFVLGFLS